MQKAVVKEPLDFATIGDEIPLLYRRTKSNTHPEKLRRLRTKLIERQRSKADRLPLSKSNFREPRYDELFFNSMAALDEAEGR
jgi:hypothetical protein